MNKNQPADTPITEEALREKGFTASDMHDDFFFRDVGDAGVYCNTQECFIINCGSVINIPGVRTMEGLGDLVRLLGGADE